LRIFKTATLIVARVASIGAVAAVSVGLAMGSSPGVRRMLGPTTEFLRALPVIANAMFVAAFSLLVSGLILGVHISVSTWPAIALVIFVATFSCTGLGLICAGIGLRVRETAVLNNVIFGLLLVFTGANLRIAELPGWMQAISQRVPLTHGIEAARRVANGASLGDVSRLLFSEALIGVVYTFLGYQLLLFMERESRKRASLQVA